MEGGSISGCRVRVHVGRRIRGSPKAGIEGDSRLEEVMVLHPEIEAEENPAIVGLGERIWERRSNGQIRIAGVLNPQNVDVAASTRPKARPAHNVNPTGRSHRRRSGFRNRSVPEIAVDRSNPFPVQIPRLPNVWVELSRAGLGEAQNVVPAASWRIVLPNFWRIAQGEDPITLGHR